MSLATHHRQSTDSAVRHEVFEGQCQCGAIHYRIAGEALTMFACHCTECQRQSGSAFGMALWIKQPVVDISGGSVKEWIRQLPSGKQMSCQFCPDCGTRLFHKVLGQEEVLSIKPGTLTRPRNLAPAGHIWLGSKQPWTIVDHNVLQYVGNPETMGELCVAWANACERSERALTRWVAIFSDTPAMLDIRNERQDLHFEYLRRNASEIRIAGGCRKTPVGDFVGGLWVLEVASRERAVELIEQDPYFVPNCRTYKLLTWGKAFADLPVLL